MNCIRFMFLSVMVMALAISLLAEPNDHQVQRSSTYDDDEDSPLSENVEPNTSLRGASRFLAQRLRFSLMRCNRQPRVCRVKGSPGPDCCRNRCVNVARDRFNCGRCGHKCKYLEICCKGKCVNPFTNKQHCGGCNNKCKKGSKCMFGMCSYA